MRKSLMATSVPPRVNILLVRSDVKMRLSIADSLAYPQKKDRDPINVFYLHISISLARMGTSTQRYPVAILFGLLQWSGSMPKYQMRRP
jgi:hypothetical protein